MHFSIEDTSGEQRRFVLALQGELDTSTAAAVSERIGRLPDEAHVCLDLRELSYIDSSGLRAIVNAKQRFGQQLRIVGTRPEVQHVFEAAGAMRVLTEQPSS
jgi:anti-anti-sigma factor